MAVLLSTEPLVLCIHRNQFRILQCSYLLNMQLTAEQENILSTNENIVINAVAGSGKTTTLIEYTKTRNPNSKILYLAFNRSVKLEAEQKFVAAGVSNVKVETAHSLAFDHVVKFSKYKVGHDYKSYDWVEMLGILSGDRHRDYMIGSHVNRFISYFCNSAVSKVQSLNYTDAVTEPKAKQFAINFYEQIENCTRRALAKMNSGEIDITHDFYLKKFQLGYPQLNYDYILFDEGQDASAAMLDVFLNQSSIKIIVGDIHQQIYGWRYAVNSLQQVDFPLHVLSNSFRFDDEVALIANKILQLKEHLHQKPSVKVIGAGIKNIETSTKATLARTNLSLLMNAIAQKEHGNIGSVYFEGNINSYTFADEGASLYDVLNLYNGKPDKIRDKLLSAMKSMSELEDYIDRTEDNSLRMIVEVVKEFGNDLPRLINQLKENHAANKQEADMIFSTVHRCKGMEYDEITLLNDFITEEKLKKYIAEMGGDKITDADKNRLAEEINILYVAATRARNKLAIPPEISPLKSIEITAPPAAQQSFKYTGKRDRWLEDEYEKLISLGDLYEGRYGYSRKGSRGRKR